MRTYFAFRNTGEISGVVMHHGAWPEGYDLMASNPSHPLAKANREVHASKPDFAGFVVFDCACENVICNCPANASFNHYVQGGQLVAKPDLVVKVNGEVVVTTEDAPALIAPNTDFTLSLEASVPDGTTVQLRFEGARMAPTNPTLTFTNGVASTTLRAPLQGASSRALQAVLTKYVRPFNLYVLGWE